MTTVTISLLFFFFFVVVSGSGILRIANAQANGQGAWCVAKPSSSDEELNNNINYVCGEIKDACDLIQPGGPCYEPQTLINHASVLMNLYFQENGRHYWNCDFKYSGIVSVKDPSYGECKYKYAP